MTDARRHLAVHHWGVALRTRARLRLDPVRTVPPAALSPGRAGDDLTDRADGRQSWWRVAVGLVAVAAVAAAAVGASRDGGDGTRLSSTGPAAEPPASGETRSSTAPPATTNQSPAPATAPESAAAPGTSTPPAPAAATATAATAASTAATTAPAPSTAAAPATAPCRNSADPACGPFRFDPQPAADRPMTLTVTTEPTAVAAGTEVVFRVALNDPDGVGYGASVVDFGDGIGLGASSVQSCRKFGAWDPPAPGSASAVEVVEYRHVFQAPGTYTARFSFDAGPFDCTDATTGRGDRPFASSAAGEVTVVVVAP